ncbi:hypothetical protein LguiA_007067 [Lonicera macranthoides]
MSIKQFKKEMHSLNMGLEDREEHLQRPKEDQKEGQTSNQQDKKTKNKNVEL